jgi:integrase
MVFNPSIILGYLLFYCPVASNDILQHPRLNVTLIVTSASNDGLGVTMTNTTKPLTNTEVKQAKPKAKEYNLADGHGLYLRVKPSGTKLWIFNYLRPFTKKRANLGLGIFPDISLADARVEAQKFKGLLAKEIDPKEYRIEQAWKDEKAHTNTFEHVAEKWLKLKESKVSNSYYKKISSRLELHVFPRIGKLPLHKINAVDTIEALDPLAKQGKLETLDNICGWINEVMVYSVNTGLVHSNPLSNIKKAFNSPKSTPLPALKPDELPELMIALNKASIKLVTRCLLEWQLHTMVRPAEAAGARWEEIDLKNSLWEIPENRMKGGKPHNVPLSPQALSLLDILKPFSRQREFIFPGDRNPRKSANSQTANMALKRMGFQGRQVAHGLRALASTTLNEQGFDKDVVEIALAHVDQNAIRAAYNRAEYLERRRVMMCWWSDHIEQAATGKLSLSSNVAFLNARGR